MSTNRCNRCGLLIDLTIGAMMRSTWNVSEFLTILYETAEFFIIIIIIWVKCIAYKWD